MMSRVNEKKADSEFISVPLFGFSAFFADRIIYYCSRRAETLTAVSAAPASSSSAFVP